MFPIDLVKSKVGKISPEAWHNVKAVTIIVIAFIIIEPNCNGRINKSI